MVFCTIGYFLEQLLANWKVRGRDLSGSNWQLDVMLCLNRLDAFHWLSWLDVLNLHVLELGNLLHNNLRRDKIRLKLRLLRWDAECCIVEHVHLVWRNVLSELRLVRILICSSRQN